MIVQVRRPYFFCCFRVALPRTNVDSIEPSCKLLEDNVSNLNNRLTTFQTWENRVDLGIVLVAIVPQIDPNRVVSKEYLLDPLIQIAIPILQRRPTGPRSAHVQVPRSVSPTIDRCAPQARRIG